MTLANSNDEVLVGQVRNRYGRIAAGEISGCGCGVGAGCETEVAQGIGYGADELAELPDEANLGLGCGAPITHVVDAELERYALVPGVRSRVRVQAPDEKEDEDDEKLCRWIAAAAAAAARIFADSAACACWISWRATPLAAIASSRAFA